MTLSHTAPPAMGWNSWNAYRAHGVTEELVLRNADALIDLGLADAGYTTVVVDDGWQASNRDDRGRLRACPQRFPHGMGWLGKQLHERGLRFGMYLSPGRRTCAQYWDHYGDRTPGRIERLLARADLLAPQRAIDNATQPPASYDLGSYGRTEADLNQLIEWEVDYLKYDWCRAERGTTLESRPETFKAMSELIEKAPREIYYAISEYGDTKPWAWAPEVANSWRVTPDIARFPNSLFHIAQNVAAVGNSTRPGHVGDADMLQVGNMSYLPTPLRYRLERTHVLLWAMLGSPLMIGTDLTHYRAHYPLIRILKAPDVLAIMKEDVACARLVNEHGPVWSFQRDLGGRSLTLEVNTSPIPRRTGGGQRLSGYESVLHG